MNRARLLAHQGVAVNDMSGHWLPQSKEHKLASQCTQAQGLFFVSDNRPSLGRASQLHDSIDRRCTEPQIPGALYSACCARKHGHMPLLKTLSAGSQGHRKEGYPIPAPPNGRLYDTTAAR